MQFDDPDDMFCRRIMQVLFYLLLPVILACAIFGVLLALPFYMLIMILSKPCQWL